MRRELLKDVRIIYGRRLVDVKSLLDSGIQVWSLFLV